MKKRLVMAVLAAILILVSLGSCSRCSRAPDLPCEQLYTKWESEDGKIVLYVDGDQRFFGTIDGGEEKIDVRVSIPIPGEHMWVHPILTYDGEEFNMGWDRIIDIPLVEHWMYKYNSSPGKNNKIVITVEETTYFEVGQKIVLWRTGENLSSEEIEYPPIKLPEYYYLYEEYEDLLEHRLATEEEIVEKYGSFDYQKYDDRLPYKYGYYIGETDEYGNPKYLICVEVFQDDGRFLMAYLTTPKTN